MAEIDYDALVHSLSSRRFLPQVFDTAQEAKAAALEIIGRNVNGGNGVFCGMVGRYALDGKAQNHAGLLVGLCLGARLGLANDSRRFVHNFIAQGVEHLFLGLLRRHAGNALKPAVDLELGFIEITLTPLKLSLKRGNLILASIERLDTTI